MRWGRAGTETLLDLEHLALIAERLRRTVGWSKSELLPHLVHIERHWLVAVMWSIGSIGAAALHEDCGARTVIGDACVALCTIRSNLDTLTGAIFCNVDENRVVRRFLSGRRSGGGKSGSLVNVLCTRSRVQPANSLVNIDIDVRFIHNLPVKWR